MRASLHRAMLHYGGNLMLHTASSGPVSGLHALYLHLDDGDVAGTGEVRINIAYLNGLSEDAVEQEAIALFETIDWSRKPEALLADATILKGVSAPVRMLLDGALHDLISRRAGLPLAHWLGGDRTRPIKHATNQTLFISSSERFLEQADAYVSRGFRDLKVRVGSGGFAEDMARLESLRARFGSKIKLAIDANGAWTFEEALENLSALAPINLAYVEQPIAAGNWAALSELADKSAIPLMLDESVAGQSDVDAIIAANGRLWAHLKLVKMGGIAPTMKAATRLREAGIPFMIGQMNEGGLATAAALHVACAAQPKFAELYGADGIENDPAPGLAYENGSVSGTQSPGLGLEFDASKTRLIREFGQ
ncbi:MULTISPECIES: mandelate racemase/muconate lactonizing enzyme family protein [unclassified Mesorhizobium]|uniref:mandelate racemase/muconate lactonizing enzyme family protein n=1 Tax=unclassified Mesorhizobium TaxID=325217 RepID=UPI0030151973